MNSISTSNGMIESDLGLIARVLFWGLFECLNARVFIQVPPFVLDDRPTNRIGVGIHITHWRQNIWLSIWMIACVQDGLS